MAKTILRLTLRYGLLLGGIVIAYRRLIVLPQPDLMIASILVGAFFLIFLIPLVVFSAKIQPNEEGLIVQQYVTAQLGYEEVRGCHGFLIPPFHMIIITTKRRFPLNILLMIQGTLIHRGTVSDQVRAKMENTGQM